MGPTGCPSGARHVSAYDCSLGRDRNGYELVFHKTFHRLLNDSDLHTCRLKDSVEFYQLMNWLLFCCNISHHTHTPPNPHLTFKPPLELKYHFDWIVVNGCTGICRFDNVWCSQWRKRRQYDMTSPMIYLNAVICTSVYDILISVSSHCQNCDIRTWSTVHHRVVWFHPPTVTIIFAIKHNNY